MYEGLGVINVFEIVRSLGVKCINYSFNIILGFKVVKMGVFLSVGKMVLGCG